MIGARRSDGGARDIHVKPEIQWVFAFVIEWSKVRLADVDGRVANLFQLPWQGQITLL